MHELSIGREVVVGEIIPFADSKRFHLKVKAIIVNMSDDSEFEGANEAGFIYGLGFEL
jgi:hypothetical protein